MTFFTFYADYFFFFFYFRKVTITLKYYFSPSSLVRDATDALLCSSVIRLLPTNAHTSRDITPQGPILLQSPIDAPPVSGNGCVSHNASAVRQ